MGAVPAAEQALAVPQVAARSGLALAHPAGRLQFCSLCGAHLRRPDHQGHSIR